jgi:hypothetical protein
MRSVPTVVGLFMIASLGAPAVWAQAEDAPHPSPDLATLYAHGTGDDEFNGFMNALEDDGGDDALGSGNLVNSDVTWTITLAPALAGALVLDTESPIVATAYIGASQGVGRVTVSTQLLHGETVVAEGDGQAHTVTPATAAPDGLYGTVDWEMTPTVERLEPGADLVWTITASGSSSSIFVGIGEGRGRSNIALPIAAVELGPLARTLYEDVTEPVFDVEIAAANATSDTYIYNWSTEETVLEATVGAEVDNGSARVVIVDAANQTLLETEQGPSEGPAPGNASGSASGNQSGPSTEDGSGGEPPMISRLEGEPGNWTIRIEFDNFTGTLRLSIALPQDVGEITPGFEDDNATALERNGTDDAAIPVAAHVAIVALAASALAAHASQRRRRG